MSLHLSGVLTYKEATSQAAAVNSLTGDAPFALTQMEPDRGNNLLHPPSGQIRPNGGRTDTPLAPPGL